MGLNLIPLEGFPLVKPGDDLASLVAETLAKNGFSLQDGDIVVLAQKIVSKAEDRLVNLTTVDPSEAARDYAECREVVRVRQGLMIVEHRLGFISANAGIDHSNVSGPWGEPQDWVLLLPEDPDASAAQIRAQLQARYACRLGVLIIDSHGRAWRNGTIGMTIGLSGLPGLVDLRGQADLFDFRLRITQVAASDELAAGASLMMGQAREGSPVVLARGFPYPLREASLSELIRNKDLDLFR
jgi:coenzyme F420-0:L-glutamate ligase/coenzyme F420-1:gamma-L-glutamate ligase